MGDPIWCKIASIGSECDRGGKGAEVRVVWLAWLRIVQTQGAAATPEGGAWKWALTLLARPALSHCS